MKTTFLILAFCASALLAGCAANSADYITYFLNKDFRDHPVHEFFYAYGYPTGGFRTAGNGRTYVWTSARPRSRPLMAEYVVRTSAGGTGYYHLSDDYQGDIERQYCELRIYTDSHDIIKGFAIAVDSNGKWSASRCSEIFDNP